MLKRTILASAAVVATVAVGSLSGTASAAGTTQVFSGYGFDGNAHLIVGGGSTTLYKMAQSFATLWDSSASCLTNNSNNNVQSGSYPPAATATGAAYNECLPTKQTYTGVDAGGNYDGDTVAIAAPTGSSDGIASLNGDAGTVPGTYAYEGTNSNITSGSTTNNGFGTVDFALSSRAGKTSGGNCPKTGPKGSTETNDEFACDTFWGVASDGVEILTFNSHAGLAPGKGGSISGQLTGQDLANIWTCKYTNWDQIPKLKLKSAPIVPWGMNSGSGTYADFNNYVIAHSTAGSTFTPNSGKCDRELSNGSEPLENDIKPIVNDAALNKGSGNYKSLQGLSRSATSKNNPSNWIWFGSFGLLSAFPYTSQYVYSGKGDGGSAYHLSTLPAPVLGIKPSSSDIFSEKYPILRILNLVTANSDATCALNKAGKCDLTAQNPPKNGNGTRDINVKGANTGKGGAVREFIRFLCRSKSTQEATDPYTGKNELTEINAAKTASGFEPIPVALRTKGSSCDVSTNL